MKRKAGYVLIGAICTLFGAGCAHSADFPQMASRPKHLRVNPPASQAGARTPGVKPHQSVPSPHVPLIGPILHMRPSRQPPDGQIHYSNPTHSFFPDTFDLGQEGQKPSATDYKQEQGYVEVAKGVPILDTRGGHPRPIPFSALHVGLRVQVWTTDESFLTIPAGWTATRILILPDKGAEAVKGVE